MKTVTLFMLLIFAFQGADGPGPGVVGKSALTMCRDEVAELQHQLASAKLAQRKAVNQTLEATEREAKTKAKSGTKTCRVKKAATLGLSHC